MIGYGPSASSPKAGDQSNRTTKHPCDIVFEVRLLACAFAEGAPEAAGYCFLTTALSLDIKGE
jgi:hypothetical protein